MTVHLRRATLDDIDVAVALFREYAAGLDIDLGYQDFEEELERWQKDDLHVKFLPPYCPELNLIELLWRKIKYEWLPLDAYLNFKALTASLFDVLKGIGSKYRITFA